MRIGRHEVFVVSDGVFHLDGGTMFGIVPKVLWEKCVAPDDKNRIPVGLNCLLIRSEHGNVLVDTGMGREWGDKSQIYALDEHRHLPASLRELNTLPEDISVVVLTHLHLDHTGWCTNQGMSCREPFFPRARYLIQEGEWQEALNPDERRKGSFVREHFAPLMAAGVVEFIRGDREITPGIRCFVTGGHTGHHQCVRIDSEGQTMLYGSEIIATRHHLRPAWGMAYDDYPVEATEVKMDLIKKAIEGNWTVVLGHDADMPVVRLQAGREGTPMAVPLSE